jgi:hypothetical protein
MRIQAMSWTARFEDGSTLTMRNFAFKTTWELRLKDGQMHFIRDSGSILAHNLACYVKPDASPQQPTRKTQAAKNPQIRGSDIV